MPILAQQKVEVIIDLIDRVTKKKKALISSTEEIRNGVERLTQHSVLYTKKSKVVPRTLEQIRSGAITATEGVDRLRKVTKDLSHVQTVTTKGTRGFRMELLSVMFFGMQLSRVFGGMIKSVLELLGVTEMWGAVMNVVLLPVLEPLSDILYSIMEWLMDQPPWVHKLIGVLVLLGFALGTALFMFGQFGLGILGVAKAFPWILKLGAIFKGVITGIGVGVGTIIAIIAVIVAIIIGMVVAWKENFMKMREFVSDFVGNIKGIFKALIDFIKACFGFFIAIFKGDWDAACQHIKDGFKAVQDFFKNIILGILNFCAMVAIGVIRVFKGIVDAIVGFFKWLYDKLIGRSIIPDIVNGIINLVAKIPGKIWDFFKGIPGKILGLFKDLGKKLYDLIMPKALKEAFEIIGGGIKKVGKWLGFQYGGIVPGRLGTPVPIIAHAGERIIPAGRPAPGAAGVTFAPVITIYASVASDYDVRRLADTLKRYWVEDFERLTQGRGAI